MFHYPLAAIGQPDFSFPHPTKNCTVQFFRGVWLSATAADTSRLQRLGFLFLVTAPLRGALAFGLTAGAVGHVVHP